MFLRSLPFVHSTRQTSRRWYTTSNVPARANTSNKVAEAQVGIAMAKPLTEEDVQSVATLVVSLQEILENAEEVELWTQLLELHDWMASAMTKPASVEGASALQISETIASRFTEIHSQLIALSKEPLNSVQFFYICKHLGEVLPELGIRQEPRTDGKQIGRVASEVHLVSLASTAPPAVPPTAPAAPQAPQALEAAAAAPAATAAPRQRQRPPQQCRCLPRLC